MASCGVDAIASEVSLTHNMVSAALLNPESFAASGMYWN